VYSKKLTTHLIVNLPAGDYEVEWWLPTESAPRPPQPWKHPGGESLLKSPEFAEDAAVVVRKR
jgi:hypothetical protein